MQIKVRKPGQKMVGIWFLGLLELILLIVTGVHSLSLLDMTLPKDSQWVAWFGLCGLDIGLMLWVATFIYWCDGELQQWISGIMILVCFAGVSATFVTDMFIQANRNGLASKVSPDTTSLIVVLVAIVILVNIGAFILHRLVDPDMLQGKAATQLTRNMANERASAELALQQKELDMEIAATMQTLKYLEEQIPVQAQARATQMASRILDRTEQTYLQKYERAAPAQLPPAPPPATQVYPAAPAQVEPVSQQPVQPPTQPKKKLATVTIPSADGGTDKDDDDGEDIPVKSQGRLL